MRFGRHDSASDWWQALEDTLAHARDNAADRAHAVGGRARDRLDDAGSEAQRRAGRAWDALAGRPAPRPWLAIGAAAALGVAVGWLAAEAYRGRRQIEHALNVAGERAHEAKAVVDERVGRAKATPGGPVEKAKAAFSSDDDEGST